MTTIGRRLAQIALMTASATALAVSAAPAMAQAQPRTFNIPAQPLSAAILEFSRQSDVMVIVAPELTAGKRSQAVKGAIPINVAIGQLLRGSGLRAVPNSAGGYRIEAGGGGQAASPKTSGRVSSSATESASSSEDDEAVNALAHDEIVVTGTLISGRAPVGSRIVTLDRKAIDATGAGSVQDTLRVLPQNFGGGASEITQTVNTGAGLNNTYGSGVNLRGLGPDATLTLVNGRRLAPAGQGTFTDVSTIPLGLVDRIEIVPDGASATYGSDAIGGVVNIILRKNFDGAQTRFRYGAFDGGDAPEVQLGQAFGKAWSSGHILIGYEFAKRDSLAMSGTKYTAQSDLRPFGGSNFDSPQANPGTITRIGTTNVVLGIPSGQNGMTLTESQLLGGVTNFANTREQSDLIPEQTRHSVLGSISQDVTPGIELFADVLYSHRKFSARDNRAGQFLSVPETNAYRIQNQLFPGRGALRIAYNLTDDIGPLYNSGKAEAFSGAFGANVDLANSWKLSAFATYSFSHETADQSGSVDAGALSAALASSSLATAFNPFADGSNTTPAVLASLIGSNSSFVRSSVRTANVKFDGKLIDLPAGAVRLAVGGELRREELRYTATTTSSSGIITDTSTGVAPGRRDAAAVFGELFVPVVGEANALPFVHALELSVSARFDDIDAAGRSFSPKLGVEYEPLPGLAFTGSYGESFKAPFLKDTNAGTFGQVATVTSAIDPQAGAGTTTLLATLGGNPDLRPETAKSWTYGVQLRPAAVAGFRASVTSFHIRYKDRVATPAGGVLARIFAEPQLYPGVLVRNPSQSQVDTAVASAATFFGPLPTPGSIQAIVALNLTNLASVQIDGLDFSSRYEFPLGGGRSWLGVDGTYIYNFEQRDAATGPSRRILNTFSNPVDLKMRGTAGWERGGFGVTGSANYINRYRDDISQPNRKINSWTTFDFQLRYSGAADSWLKGTDFSLSVINLFDRGPPFANNSQGFAFDPTNSNPLGRTWAISVTHNW